ncbi:MAG TPA: hypothetical protein VN032_05530, partial [Thermoanaerobaculia bacterium]|nr:hypothetical protein [Thermoanaerobaculia bacterium]
MSRTARDRPNRESPTSNHGLSLLLAALPWIVFAFLTLVSWQRWIEPWVDAGRELMVPSRVAQGERLYRDVRFYYGPLAPYVAAGVERAAPQSLPARILLSAAVALLHVEALRRLAFRALPAGRAALAVSLAVAIGFFLWPGGCHLFPYSLDTSLAVAAATWALVSASRPEADGAVSVAFWLFAALTSRPEIGLAAAALVVITPVARERGARFAPSLLRAAGAAVAAAAAVYAILSRATPLATLRQEGWLAFLSVPQEFRNVYLSFAGLDRPALRLSELAIALLLLLVVAGGLALLAYAARAGGTRAATAMTAAAALALTLVALACLRPPPFLEAPLSLLPPMVRPLPLFVIACALWRTGTRLAGTRDRGI